MLKNYNRRVLTYPNMDSLSNSGDALNTMYITFYGSYNGNYNFMLTYHSNNNIDKR